MRKGIFWISCLSGAVKLFFLFKIFYIGRNLQIALHASFMMARNSRTSCFLPSTCLLQAREYALYIILTFFIKVYGTKRQANVTAPNPMIVNDMTEMCKFVYDFYAGKVAALQKIVPPQNPAGEIKKTMPEGKTSQHPADDRDSDDEAEGKAAPVMQEIVNEVVE